MILAAGDGRIGQSNDPRQIRERQRGKQARLGVRSAVVGSVVPANCSMAWRRSTVYFQRRRRKEQRRRREKDVGIRRHDRLGLDQYAADSSRCPSA